MGRFVVPFAFCILLQSMKGWPASMTVIPAGTFWGCTGMATVGCDISHVTSIGADGHGHAFTGCTSLLPPSLFKDSSQPTGHARWSAQTNSCAARCRRRLALITPRPQAGGDVARWCLDAGIEFDVVDMMHCTNDNIPASHPLPISSFIWIEFKVEPPKTMIVSSFSRSRSN